MAKIGDVSLILKLLAGLVLGALLGFVANEAVMDVVVSLRHIFGQIIFFLVPLVIVGFITPAIVRLGQNASKILVVAVCLAYASSLGAALFSMGSGYLVIPHLSIATETETLRKLPEMVFRLDIPPLFSVMSALVTALFFGVAIAWTKSETLGKVFAELERIMTWLVTRVLIPILPFFVGLSFMGLAYEGSLTKHLPIFVTMVALVILGHLADRAVRHRRDRFGPQSLPGLPLLHARLSYRRGHHVQRRHPARGPGVRAPLAGAQPDHGGIHGAAGRHRASLRLGAHGDFFLYDHQPDPLRHPALGGHHAAVLRPPGHFRRGRARRARRHGGGLAGHRDRRAGL